VLPGGSSFAMNWIIFKESTLYVFIHAYIYLFICIHVLKLNESGSEVSIE
jgi:hypothetical protein